MGGRAPPPLRLPRRRLSVPETVMRKCLLAREKSETEDEPSVVSGPAPAYSPRDLERCAGLLRRLTAAPDSSSPYCCDTRSLDGVHNNKCAGLTNSTLTSKVVTEPHSVENSLGTANSEMSGVVSSPPPDLLEIVISATSPPAATSHHMRTPGSRSLDCNLNIDEYVSNILVDSLNTLTDRLESMSLSVGGDGFINVVEKEIKVKLQNTGINTVVHLSPTSNNQIIFGNEELYERDVAPPPPIQRLFCEELDAGESRWRQPSPCTSLVDSLDDPSSPRVLPPPPAASDARCFLSPIGPADNPSHKENCGPFFIRMTDDSCACETENIVVADHMPEKIKQRLVRRHRRREMRAQGARRSRGGPGHAAAARAGAGAGAKAGVQRHCAALVDALIDDAISRIAREEYRCARIARKREPSVPEENTSRIQISNGRCTNSKEQTELVHRPEPKRASPSVCTSQLPPPSTRDRGPRRLYHKSEIHDGGKCIEILEIVEYTNASRSSSETNSDESINFSRNKKSRIPVPIQDKCEMTRVRRSSVPSSVLVPAPAEAAAARRSSVPAGPAAAERPHPPGSGVFHFERVFDVIPEERSSLSLESANEEAGSAAAAPLHCSVATSPPAPAPAGTVRARARACAPLPPPSLARRTAAARARSVLAE